MSRQPANRHVKHKNGWEIDIRVSERILSDLSSRNHEVRESAQRAICTKFRMVCQQRFTNWLGEWVEFKDLVLTVITSEQPRELVATTVGFNPNCRCDTKFRCPEHDA